VVKRRNIILRDRNNGYRAYVFKKSIKYYAINYKG